MNCAAVEVPALFLAPFEARSGATLVAIIGIQFSGGEGVKSNIVRLLFQAYTRGMTAQSDL